MPIKFTPKAECSTRTIFPGVNIFTMTGDNMTLSLVECEPGSVVEEHSHPHEQMGMVLEGKGRFFVGDEDKVLVPGDMYAIPGNVKHRVVALDEGLKALDVFHPIREEYK